MHDLATAFLGTLSSGLARHGLTTCSRYAERVRVMGPPYPGKWTFEHHPWLRDMHDCSSEMMVGQKAAQMGYTETLLNITFYTIDRLGQNVLYVLPNKSPDATDFTASRFQPALELSEHLQNLFTDTDNVGHKRAGSANLYVRGSQSKAGLRSIPVQMIALDEVDVMNQENIPLALERVSGQPVKSVKMISTPTIPNYGINRFYESSDKRLFYFKCPSCSRSINLEFPRNLEIAGDDPYKPEIKNTRLFCHLCKATLNHEHKPMFLKNGVWVPQRQSDAVGFHTNQLYSCAIKPYELARKYLLGNKSESGEQEFYNSALGLPHAVAGSRITDEMVAMCTGDHKLATSWAGGKQGFVITMGVDIGKRLHYEIDKWTWYTTPNGVKSVCTVLAANTVSEFNELFGLIENFSVCGVVLDMNPERRAARDFCMALNGLAEMCEYAAGGRGREIVVYNDEHRIQVDRTAWLDVSLGRFRHNAIKIPCDSSYEYKEHIKALTKCYYRDREGNMCAKYLKGGDEDHFAHARNYSEIAFARVMSRLGSDNGTNPLF